MIALLKDQVLYLLEQQKGSMVSGGRLADELGVSRTAIWKAIRALQEEGNEIVSVPQSGYRLFHTNDTLVEQIIREKLTTQFIGQSMTVLPTVHSTNQYLKEMDAAGTPGGYAVIADEQTNGRGRRNRAFLSPKGGGVYTSILLQMNSPESDVRMLTICAAVSAAKAIETVCGIKADIKWVNDIYCNGKKICGILTEAVITGESQEVSTAIVGIGINTARVPDEIGGIATSIQEETGLRGTRNRLAAEVLNQFEATYLDYTARKETHRMIADYASRLFIAGKRVLVSGANQSYPATVLGIDEAGALIVKDERGETRHVISGEIQLE